MVKKLFPTVSIWILAVLSTFPLPSVALASEFNIAQMPSVLESGSMEVSYTFSYSTANAYSPYNFEHHISIMDISRGYDSVRTMSSVSRTISGYVSLRPGVYRISSGYSYEWREPYAGGKEHKVTGSGPSHTFTVTGAPQGVYQVYPDPLVLDIGDCNQDFSLYWEKDVDSDVISAGGKVFYTIEEESVPDGADFEGNWVMLEGAHPSVVNNAETESESLETYHFTSSKAPGKQYRYRVSTRYQVGQFQSRQVFNHQGFGSIRKSNCSQTDVALTSDIANLANKTVLDIAPVSEAGVSYNRIDDFGGVGFNIVDRPLAIRNFANAEGKVAELIVIETSDVTISQPISITGHNASLLIINNSPSPSASFRCVDQCEFHNVNRITLANAWRDDEYGAGSLQVNNTSTMQVRGLLAPGAHSVDLMAGTIDLDGFVSSNLRARLNSVSGQYELSDEGALSAGIGAVNIFSGGVFVDYATLNIERVRPLDTTDYSVLSQTTIRGSIEAASVSIVTTENVEVGAHINTNVDVLAATPYTKKSYIPNDIDKLYTPVEDVRLETFGRRATFNLSGAITTKATASILSNNHLRIANSISAQTATLVAGKHGRLTIAPGVSVVANTVNAAADAFENNGLIAAKSYADIGAKIALINQYGGRIQAPTVKLTSSDGYIRNGSLLPYRVTSGEASFAGTNAARDYQDGTYYDLDNAGANASNTQKVSDLSAKVVASYLHVAAATSVENINPYFVVNRLGEDWSDGVPFSKRLSQQVGLYGTRDVEIIAGNKVLNSSAEIHQMDPAGSLSISTKNLNNQRYRTEVVLGNYASERNSISTNVDCSGRPDCNTQAYTFEQSLSANPVLYSPPGLIYVAGNIDASPFDSGAPLQLSTLNDASYVEVMGDANFYGDIVSVGILDYDIKDLFRYDGCAYYGARGPGDPGGCSSSSGTRVTVDYVGELDALFRVHGIFRGPEVNWVEKNGDAALGFIAQATGTSINTLRQKVENHTFEQFVRDSFDQIVDYIETFMNSLLNAWDVVTNWFA